MNEIWIMDATTKRPRHANAIRKAILWSLIPGLVLFFVMPFVGNAQQAVTTNITSSGFDTVVPLQPPSDGVYNITGGTRPGDGPNLFHSFGDFSVGQGDIANFLNDTQLPTSNILGRITGGNTSNIYGTIQTTDFGNANLFLVNPSGIVFGPNGSVNVGGSVSFSSAQYLRLFDSLNGESANFYADAANDGLANSVLAVAPVVDFGFLSPAAYGFLTAPDPSATITIHGSALSVLPGQSISLVGREVVIQGATFPDGTSQPAHLSAPDGSILLASAASPGEFDVATLQALPNVDGVSGVSFTSFGSVSLALGSSIDVHGTSSVFVKGGQLVLSVKDATLTTTSDSSADSDTISLSPGSSFVTSNSGAEPGADVQITVGNLNLDGSAITTETFGDGNGGNITANVGTLSLDNFATIGSNNFSSGIGQGGNVTVQGLQGADSAAVSVTLNNGASISTQTFGPGLGGDVRIVADTIGLDGAGTVITTGAFGDGNGGNITANVKTLSVTNGATISSNNLSFGLGQGGNVTVQGLAGPGSAAESVTLSNTNAPTITTVTAIGAGRGGDVSITADTLLIENASGISTDTCCPGDFGGGTGVGGNLVLNVGTLTLKGGPLGVSTIRTADFTGTDLDGDGVQDTAGVGGKVIIQGIHGGAADSVVLSGGSQIVNESTGGNGGQVSIATTFLNMDEASTISSTAVGIGRGGDIVVAVQDASFSGGATIISQSLATPPNPDAGEGKGGSITVQGLKGAGSKAGSLTFAGFRSGIISDTFGFALPGDIEVHAGTVSLTDGAVIEGGNSDSRGAGGSVEIFADSVGVSGGSHISSQTFAQDAGQVAITANKLTLDNGSIVTSTSSEFGGRGGAVVLDVGSVSLANRSTINSSTSQTGPAGDIAMTVGTLSLANGSSISSASTGAVVTNPNDGTTQVPGRSGNVVITASGGFTSDASTVATSAEANHGGDISITADSVHISSGSVITANSKAPLVVTKDVLDQDGLPVKVEAVGDDGRSDGNAGNVIITSASNVVMQNSKVTTEASAASGGSIEINASDTGMIQLINSKVSTSVGGVAGSNGGNISIDPQFVVLQNSQILAQAFAGAGGAINIIATSAFIADPASIVNASSTLGISGSVNIQSPLQNIGGELAALTEEFSSAAALLAQQCAARVADGKFSTFVIAAREGLPAEPGGFLASPSLTTELLGSRLSGRDPQTRLSAVTGLFPKYDAKPIQLAKLGDSCHRQ